MTPTPTWQDELVRDLTKVGSISKSEARRRIKEAFSSELRRITERLEGEKTNDSITDDPQRTYTHNAALDRAIEIVEEEAK